MKPRLYHRGQWLVDFGDSCPTEWLLAAARWCEEQNARS